MAAAATLLAVGGAANASAHVRVHPDSTTTGSFSQLTFRVPNESDTAGTVKVAVQLPQDTPFVYVSSKPVPGWTATTSEAALPTPVDLEGTTITKAVRTVTWTAASGTQIKPGEYQEFSLSVGPLPAPGTVLLPATQTYSDGEVVEWNEATPASGEEPENPAPELVITAADASPAPSAAPSASPTGSGGDTAGTATGSTDGATRGLAIAGLVAGVAGLALGGVSLARRRS